MDINPFRVHSLHNLNMVFLTHPVDAEDQDIVDDKPDCTERNGDVVPHVKSCVTSHHSHLLPVTRRRIFV